jgi:hypothetical protein
MLYRLVVTSQKCSLEMVHRVRDLMLKALKELRYALLYRMRVSLRCRFAEGGSEPRVSRLSEFWQSRSPIFRNPNSAREIKSNQR